MDKFASELLGILQFLLPGLLAAWVFYGFSAHQKGPQFERIVQALIFTLVVQAAYSIGLIGLESLDDSLPGKLSTNENYRNVLTFLVAGLVGLTFAFFANRDLLHRFLRYLKVTEQTSHPSEWFGVFSTNKTYVVLHLKDERRLYGWPKEWPQK